MKKKNLLIMVNFFPPSGGGGVYRPLSFVKYLSGMNWNVTVVTPKPGEFWIQDPDLLKQIPSQVRIERTNSLSPPRLLNLLRGKGGGGGSTRDSGRFEFMRKASEFLLLPDTYLGWVPFAVRAASRLCREKRFDVILSTSPPDSTHLAASRISSRFDIPWVVDFRDPWIGLYLREPPTSLHRRLHRRMEKKAAEAARVLVTTDWQRDRLRELYPGSRVEKIPNGYDEEDFRGLEGLNPPAAPFTITHSGMLTLGRQSKSFLAGAALFLERRAKARNRMKIVFAGARETENEAWADRLGMEGVVEFVDNLPHRKCVARERTSHVLLLIKHDDIRYRGLVPGKLYEYIGARRPVLAVVPRGEAYRIVKQLNRGETAAVDDPAEIADRIERMFSLYLKDGLDENYSLKPVPEFSRRVEAERLDRILRELVE